MLTSKRTTTFARRTLLSALFGASVAALSAQTTPAPFAADQQLPVGAAAVPGQMNLSIPANFEAPQFSSSNDTNGQVLTADASTHLPNLDAMQYGQRQRYGRPRYRGGNTNEDGSEKYTFFGGVGLAQPLGNTYHYLTPSYAFQVGGGRNFSKHFGTMVQFDYDHFGFNQRTISGQAYIYSGDANAADNGIDGGTHIWSFTVDPEYTFYSGEGVGAYVVAGVGFYHKVANFTAPQEEYYFSPIYGEIPVYVQANIDDYTSNAIGYNGGFGLTYKFSRFSNERFYAEARYVFINNSQRQGITLANLSSASATSTDFYPANSNRTTYVPVKFGIRF